MQTLINMALFGFFIQILIYIISVANNFLTIKFNINLLSDTMFNENWFNIIFNQLKNSLDPINTNFLILFSNWYSISQWITFFYMLLIIILIGLFLKNNSNHIRILNLTSVIIFVEYLISYSYDNFQIITLTQNFTYFAHLFIYITVIIGIIFFLSISEKNFFKDDTKIEFTLLVWCIIIASQYLISSLDFISIIILLECIAFSSYILVGFERKNKFSVTSGLQYLILASIPGGLFILGLILFYNNFGTFSQDSLISLLQSIGDSFYNFTDSDLNTEIIFFIFNLYLEYLPSIFLRDWNTFEVYSWTLFQYLEFVDWYLGIITPKILEIIFTHHGVVLDATKILINGFIKSHPSYTDAQNSRILDEIYYKLYNAVLHEKDPQTILLDKFHSIAKILIKQLDAAFIIFNSFLNGDFFLENSWDWFFYKFNAQTAFLEKGSYINLWSWLAYSSYMYDNFEFRMDAMYDTPFIQKKLPPYTQIGSTFYCTFKDSPNVLIEIVKDSNSIFINFKKIIFDSIFYQYFQQTTLNLIQNHFLNLSFTIGDHLFIKCLDIKIEESYLFFCYLIQGFYFINKYDAWNCFLEDLLYVNSALHSNVNTYVYIYLGIFFIIVNLSFKLTAAPFHFWAPAVYGGSPLITLTFLSIFSKTIFIFFSIWLFVNILESLTNIWQFFILIIAFLSIIVSIIGAFSEKFFKRFFVYSSTGHVGFMLLGIATLNINGLKGTIDYLILYILSSFIIWFIIMHLTKKTITLINLKGLSYNQPYLSLIFSIILFSLSGIPPLGGFFVKYEIFYSLINSSFFILAYILLLLTIISFFYYLRLIKIFYFENNKKFYKFNNFKDIKLRLICYGFFIIPFFILFAENSISIFIINILINSLF